MAMVMLDEKAKLVAEIKTQPGVAERVLTERLKGATIERNGDGRWLATITVGDNKDNEKLKIEMRTSDAKIKTSEDARAAFMSAIRAGGKVGSTYISECLSSDNNRDSALFTNYNGAKTLTDENDTWGNKTRMIAVALATIPSNVGIPTFKTSELARLERK